MARILALLLLSGLSGLAGPGLLADGDSTLAVASREGDIDRVRGLLADGVDPDRGFEDWPPIMLAAMNGEREIVRLLVDAGAAMLTLDGNLGSAVTAAAVAPFLDEEISIGMIDDLVSAGADVRSGNGARMTPLMFAARESKTAVCRALLAHGARADYRDTRGWSPLMFAVRSDNPKIVEMLLEEGADPNVGTDYPTRRPLDEVVRTKNAVITAMLLSAGADPNLAGGGEEVLSPLLEALRTRSDTIARLLIAAGADPNRMDFGWDPLTDEEYDPRTPLDWARHHGLETTAQLLEDIGAISVTAYRDRFTALQEAIEQEDHESFVSLLAADDIDYTQVPVWSDMYVDLLSAAEDRPAMLRDLLETGELGFWRGRDIYDKLRSGPEDLGDTVTLDWFRDRYPVIVLASAMERYDTEQIVAVLERSPEAMAIVPEGADAPLVAAAAADNIEQIELLLDYGAEIEIGADFGVRPLHAAARFGSIDAARLLLVRGADPDGRDDFGRTSLHRAAHFDQPEMIAILLDAGAAIDPVGYDGVTPLQTALERGSRFAATTLLMRRADRTSRCGTGESPEELAKKGGLGDLLERDW